MVTGDQLTTMCSWLFALDHSDLSNQWHVNHFRQLTGDDGIQTMEDLAYAQWGYGNIYPNF